ncbi:hypothetical protein X975_20071, partial [Stegodyphus mimosarum]
MTDQLDHQEECLCNLNVLQPTTFKKEISSSYLVRCKDFSENTSFPHEKHHEYYLAIMV